MSDVSSTPTLSARRRCATRCRRAVGDPFLYVERNGSRHVVISSMEIPLLRDLGGVELHPLEEFGMDELRRSGVPSSEIFDELAVRALRRLGVESAPRARDLSGAARRPPARLGRGADPRPAALRRPPAREVRRRARRNPARAGRGGGGDGRRAGPAPRGGRERRRPRARRRAAHERARQDRDQHRLRGARRELRRLHRLARAAVGDRPPRRATAACAPASRS